LADWVEQVSRYSFQAAPLTLKADLLTMPTGEGNPQPE